MCLEALPEHHKKELLHECHHQKMIEVKELDLVKFTCDAYSLSTPQGLGVLHAKEGALSLEEAQSFVKAYEGDKRIALSLDYIHGRSCKMTVWHLEEGGYKLADSWYDHTNAQYEDLLSRHGIEIEKEEKEVEVEKQAEDKSLGVPVGCTLDTMIRMAIAMGGKEHPCDGCNMDRKVCKGYARKERGYV
jgi:hypothetical protein